MSVCLSVCPVVTLSHPAPSHLGSAARPCYRSVPTHCRAVVSIPHPVLLLVGQYSGVEHFQLGLFFSFFCQLNKSSLVCSGYGLCLCWSGSQLSTGACQCNLDQPSKFSMLLVMGGTWSTQRESLQTPHRMSLWSGMEPETLSL